jgi:hypothetical protein
VSKHFEFDPSSQVKRQPPTTPLGGLFEKKLTQQMWLVPTTPLGGLFEKKLTQQMWLVRLQIWKVLRVFFFLLTTLNLGIMILLVVSTTCGQWT